MKQTQQMAINNSGVNPPDELFSDRENPIQARLMGPLTLETDYFCL